MTKIYMVRHGQASAGWDGGVDPGLSPTGKEQAKKAAENLAPLGPLPVLTSPMARARETALPLCSLWQVEPEIENRVAEIPSPTDELSQRGEWLQKVMQGRWSDTGPDLQAWRKTIIDAVKEVSEDSVIFSHFIAINVLVGEAVSDDSVVTFFPDNASITTLEVYEDKIVLLERGEEAGTIIR